MEILSKADGWIRVSPLPKQQEPANLHYLKNHIRQRWWMTSLLDILKEVDLRVGFSDSFQSLTGQERLPRAELQKRLLLCLYGLGTNTGLTSVSMGNHGSVTPICNTSAGALWPKMPCVRPSAASSMPPWPFGSRRSRERLPPGAPRTPSSLRPGTRIC